MMARKIPRQPVVILKSSWNTLISHPAIIFPFCIVAFLQFLALEVLFFAHRYPLNKFFAPLILRFNSEAYMHYPYNFILLVKWFLALQPVMFVLVHSFFIGAAVIVINHINNDRPVHMRSIFRETRRHYGKLFLSFAIALGSLMLIFRGLDSLPLHNMIPAVLMKGAAGEIIRQNGVALLKLLGNIVVTILFIYMVPALVVSEKNLFSALIMNFKCLVRSAGFVIAVVVLTSLLYVPVILLLQNGEIFQGVYPEAWMWILIFYVLVTLMIEAVQYTTITVYYLLMKDFG